MAFAELRPVGSVRKSSHLICKVLNSVALSSWSACSSTLASNQSQESPVMMNMSIEVQPYSEHSYFGSVLVQPPAEATEPFMRISTPTYLERSLFAPERLIRSVPVSLESAVLLV